MSNEPDNSDSYANNSFLDSVRRIVNERYDCPNCGENILVMDVIAHMSACQQPHN